MAETENWSALSPEEKKRELFAKQKALLDTFLATGAITQSQYDFSLNGLKTKMKISDAGSTGSPVN